MSTNALIFGSPFENNTAALRTETNVILGVSGTVGEVILADSKPEDRSINPTSLISYVPTARMQTYFPILINSEGVDLVAAREEASKAAFEALYWDPDRSEKLRVPRYVPGWLRKLFNL